LPPSLARVVRAALMSRSACIVAAGTFGDSFCLLKNRDRNYLPEITIIHEVKDGVEVAYMKDASTGWVEGINEHGIGVVNAALMVSRDESERDEVERTGKKLKDGDRILHALTQKTVEAAAKSVRTYKDGLKGHTIVSNGKKTLYVEMPDSNDLEYDELPADKLFVRTNHGVEFPDAGYVSGENEKSSKGRQEEAEEVLAKVTSPDDIAPALLRARDDRWEPTEMVRDNKSPRRMRTTTQMVLNLTEKKLILYVLPGRVEWKGVEDKMPKGREAKITIDVREYTDLTDDTEAETKVVKKAGVWYSGSPKKFDQFRTDVRHTFGQGPSMVPVFITQDKSFAKGYAQGPEGTIYTVRPKVRKTFDGDDMVKSSRSWPPPREDMTREGQELYDDLESNRIFSNAIRDDDDYHNVFGDSQGLLANILRMDYDVLETTEFKKWLKQKGYDSFYVTGDGPKNMAVFDAGDLEILSAEPAHGRKTAGLLPILDPAYNIREVFKQLVLLEDHLFHPRKQCQDCIWKHLLTSEALAEEAVTLDLEREHTDILDGLAERIRGLARAVQDEEPFDEVAQKAREIRKGLLGVASSVRVAADMDVPDSLSFAPFKVGDYITHGKFLNKPAKIVRMFVNEKGVPSIEVEAVGHSRRKNRIMGLYRIRHMDMSKRVASRWAGDVPMAPGRTTPRPKHTVTIGGRKYALSADGGPLGDQLESLADEGGARLVDIPAFMKPEPYRFLWAYDTEDGSVSMWRVTDGNMKVWGSAKSFSSKIVALDRKGEINWVTSAEMTRLNQAMQKKEREQLRSLQKWLAENASEYQKLVDQVAWDVFNNDIKPGIDRRLSEAKRGVVPPGFKEDEHKYRSREEQLRSHILTEELSAFTTEAIENEVRSRGVDPDAKGHDIQAAYWALNDVMQAVWEKYARYKLASDPLVKALKDVSNILREAVRRADDDWDSYGEWSETQVGALIDAVHKVDEAWTGKSSPVGARHAQYARQVLEGGAWTVHMADGGYSRLTLHGPGEDGPVLTFDVGAASQTTLPKWNQLVAQGLATRGGHIKVGADDMKWLPHYAQKVAILGEAVQALMRIVKQDDLDFAMPSARNIQTNYNAARKAFVEFHGPLPQPKTEDAFDAQSLISVLEALSTHGYEVRERARFFDYNAHMELMRLLSKAGTVAMDDQSRIRTRAGQMGKIGAMFGPRQDVNEMALDFLTDLGIDAEVRRGVLTIDRTSMVNFSPRLDENRAYEAVLSGLRGEFPDYRIYWGGRTDDWMGVEFHPRDGRGKTAEAKYKEKKKVPKADGKGTTTVYVYSEKQIEHRHREKAKRYEGLAKKIDKLRSQVTKDLGSDDPKTRLTALAVGLIDVTFERVGNDGSADEGHYGVTGWLKEHVTFGKGKVTIKYVGKSGVSHEKVVDDAKLVKALKDCCEDKKPGDPLLSFGKDDSEGLVKVSSRDVNAYLKPFDVTAKDIRGLHANREMQDRLRAVRKKGGKLPTDKKEKEKVLKAEFKTALEATAEAVGHEAATLRSQYLVPGLEDDFMKDGTVADTLKNATIVERVASAYLQRQATEGWDRKANANIDPDIMTVQDLQAVLRGANLATSGSRSVLVKRLTALLDVQAEFRGKSKDEIAAESTVSQLQGHLKAMGVGGSFAKSHLVTMLRNLANREIAPRAPTKKVPVTYHILWENPVTGRTESIGLAHSSSEAERLRDTIERRLQPVIRNVQKHMRVGDLRVWVGGDAPIADDDVLTTLHEISNLEERGMGPALSGDQRRLQEQAKQIQELAKRLGIRVATLSESEKEDREVERLSRKPPQKKPPRKDSQRNRIDTSDKEERDPDLSMNYKDIGG